MLRPKIDDKLHQFDFKTLMDQQREKLTRRKKGEDERLPAPQLAPTPPPCAYPPFLNSHISAEYDDYYCSVERLEESSTTQKKRSEKNKKIMYVDDSLLLEVPLRENHVCAH